MNGQNAWRNQDMSRDENRDAVFENAVTKFAGNVFTAQIKESDICGLSVGEGVAILLGYEAEELREEPDLWFSIVHPADETRVRQAFARLSAGEPITEIYRIYRKDGQMRWIGVSAVAAKDTEGVTQRIIGIISEATTEMRCPDRTAQYRQLLDEFPCPTTVSDMSGRTIYCNSAYARLTGCKSVDEAMQTALQDFIPEQDMDKFKRVVQPRITSRPWSGMIRIIRRDGSIRDLCTWTNLLRGLDNEPIAVYATYNDTTEHKRGVESILDREEKYRSLIERSNDGVVVIQDDAIVKLANQRFSEMSGYPVDQLLGTKFTEYLTKEENAVLYENFKRRMAGEALPSIYETVMTRSDGSKIELEINAGIIDYEGRPADLVLLRDIRERKRAERALKESEELLSAVQDSVSAHIAVLDSSGNIIAVNRAWERFASENGASEELRVGVGLNYLDACRNAAGPSSEGAKEALERLQALLDGTLDEFEIEYPCHSPEVQRWFVAHAAPLKREHGGLVISHTDITDAKKTQQALRENEERLRTLIDDVDAIIFRMDRNLRPTMIAGRTERICGHSTEDLMQNPDLWTSSLHPDDIEPLKQKVKEATKEDQHFSVEFRAILPNGDMRWIRSHITPRFDEHGEIVFYDGVDIDITEFKEADMKEARHTALIAALAEISQEFVSTLDMDKIISSAILSTAQILNCMCSMFKIDPETGRIYHVPVYCEDQELARRTENALRDVELTTEDVFGPEGIRAAMDPDAYRRSPRAAEFRQKSGVGPSLAVPLYIEGQVMGILGAARAQGEPPFDDDDLWFFNEVALHASSALTNASLYRKQSRIAETLQRSLIPLEPAVPGLEIATSYLPAKGEAKVGGDFFDIIDFKDGKVGVVVGDVSGKGLDAAIHTAESKYMLRGYARQNPDPGYVMSALNHALWTFTTEYMFVTMFYALIDPENRTMTYVNAGHECPLILCRRKERVHELSADGLILGVVCDQDYVTHRVEIAEDDLLLCYTDGVVDVPRNGDRFGYDRLVDIVAHALCATPQELLDYVTATIQEFGKGDQPDDQVIVVVRLKDITSGA